MRINSDFTIQKVGDSFVAVPVGEASRHFHGMVRLNESGAFVWNLLMEKDCTKEELVDALLEKYDVDRDTAQGDVERISKILEAHKLLV